MKFLPPYLSIYLTYACQFQCRHCFLVHAKKLNRYQLSLESVKKLIIEAHQHQVSIISLSGGDPLLYPHVDEVLSMIRERHMMAVLGITGVNLSLERAKELKALNVSCIQVSLDGSADQENQHQRPSGSFAEVLRVIEVIQEAGINANLAICLHKNNLAFLPAWLAMAKKIGIYKAKISFFQTSEEIKNSGFFELDGLEKSWVVKICHDFSQEHALKNWITLPGLSLKTGLPIKQKYPPMVVGADGLVTAGEFGKTLGFLDQLPSLAQVYASYFYQEKLTQLKDIVLKEAKVINISSFTEVDRPNFKQAALIYGYEGNYHILINHNLPEELKLFSILHEMGHIHDQTLKVDPRSERREKCESGANRWALSRLIDHLEKSFYEKLIKLANIGEDALYQELAKNFLFNLHF